MDQNTSDSLFGLQVDTSSAANFREGTKWAKFIAIVWFAGVALGILLLLFFGNALKVSLSENFPDMDVLENVFVVVCIIVFIYLLLINFLLYRFAGLIRKGLALQNQEIFNDGLKFLKYYFVINGVLAILGLVFSFVGTISDLIA